MLQDAKAIEILAAKGIGACLSYCEMQKRMADAGAYLGASQYWQMHITVLTRRF